MVGTLHRIFIPLALLLFNIWAKISFEMTNRLRYDQRHLTRFLKHIKVAVIREFRMFFLKKKKTFKNFYSQTNQLSAQFFFLHLLNFSNRRFLKLKDFI